MDIDGEEAGHQIYAGGHHGGGVDKGRDGGGALHGIRQPDVQGELGRLARRPRQHPPSKEGQNARPQGPCKGRLLQGGHVQLPHLPPDEEEGREEAQIPQPSHQEGLGGRPPGRIAVEPEADEQIRAQPHQLPEHEQLQKVGGGHQPQHGPCEQAHEGEVAAVARVPRHVALGVDLHHEGDAADHHQHHRAEAVQAEAYVYRQVPHLHPPVGGEAHSMALPPRRRVQGPQGEGQGGGDGQDGEVTAPGRGPEAQPRHPQEGEQGDEGKGAQRREDDGPGRRLRDRWHHIFLMISLATWALPQGT